MIGSVDIEERKLIGRRIRTARERAELTQADLAEHANCSQSAVSRIEAGEKTALSLKDIGSLARAVGATAWEIVEGTDLAASFSQALDDDDEVFIAFCPNPFCPSNTTGVESDGNPVVTWKSAKPYRTENFDRVNFCSECGEELLKECP